FVIHVFIVALLTVGIVRILGNIMIIYGRKLLVLSVLIGYILNWAWYYFHFLGSNGLDKIEFGLIVPGLMAYWMQRQGVVETAALALTGAVLIRFILVVITGGAVTL
ncbi:MAG: poly-gamma-glutamate biosynthesis protein PgsC/CapC, partial [Candidatus Omnitrophota bacterium]